MSQSVITRAFVEWKAQQAIDNQPVVLDEFVFANVPELDVTLPIPDTDGLPDNSRIVHRQTVNKAGTVNRNAVVYSVTLGAEVGDFDFNWIGLLNKASGTVAAIIHAPTQRKIKNSEGQQGNVLTRSILMEFNNAQQETEISVPAETWQIDFTARLAGMDERQRVENIDIYGAAAFLGDGFLVTRNSTRYSIAAGSGYVAGLRTVLDEPLSLNAPVKPVKVWVDVTWKGSLLSVWGVETKITVAEVLTDYNDNGQQHYVFAVAEIAADGSVTDLRPKGSLEDQNGAKTYLRIDAALEEIANKGAEAQAEARKNIDVLSKKETGDQYLSKKDGGTVTGATLITHTLSISAKPSGIFAENGWATFNIGDSDTGFVYPGDGRLDVYANNAKVFGWDANTAETYNDLAFRSRGEIRSESANSFRMIQYNRGVFWRFDGNNAYLMLTKDQDPLGSYNDLRPIMVNYANGLVSLGCGLRLTGGGLTVSYQEDGNIVQRGGASIFNGYWGTTDLNGALRAITNYGDSTLARANDAWNKANDAQLNRVQDIRLAGRTSIGGWGGLIQAPTGCVFTAIGDFGANDGYGEYSAVQKLINNGWYTIGGN